MKSNELKRLENTEKALIALWSLIEGSMPPEYREVTNAMMSDFFDSSTSLGADFNQKDIGCFHSNPDLINNAN